jgi:xanthine dehydrogenase accessory factor
MQYHYQRYKGAEMNLNGVIADHLARGEKGTLATIVEKTGSAPRDEGAWMFITAEGKTFGTIGGGSVEAQTCLEAIKVIKAGRHRMLHFKMDGKSAAEENMICGGNVSIFIEPVEERHKEVYEAVSNAIKINARGFVVTRYSEAGLLKSFLLDMETVVGDPLDNGTKEHIFATREGLIVSGGLIVVPILFRSCLYIFGAGHVSQHICRIASMVNFDVTVIDDRDDYSNAERFPDARETIVKDFSAAFDELPFSGSKFVVIVTRGHKHDALVLEQVLKRPARYVGMIGSHRKTRMVFNHLRDKGLDDALLAQVFAPIGLDIGAETPEEIAVSIVAELIKTSNQQGTGLNLSRQEAVNDKALHHHSPDHHKILFG